MAEPDARDEGRKPVATSDTHGTVADHEHDPAVNPDATGPGSSRMAQDAARKDGDPTETSGDTPESAMAQL